MTDYTKVYDGAAKDTAESVITGADHDVEYDALEVAVATKSNKILSATNNNLLSMDANGDMKDSGIVTDGAGTITADLTGDVTGNLTGNVTGNADTATDATSAANADTVTTNANLTGDVTSVGNATTLPAATVGAKNASLQSPTHSIGTFIFARNGSGSDKTPGQTLAGNFLTYASVTSGTMYSTGSPGTGTWTCLGHCINNYATVWCRTA